MVAFLKEVQKKAKIVIKKTRPSPEAYSNNLYAQKSYFLMTLSLYDDPPKKFFVLFPEYWLYFYLYGLFMTSKETK